MWPQLCFPQCTANSFVLFCNFPVRLNDISSNNFFNFSLLNVLNTLSSLILLIGYIFYLSNILLLQHFSKHLFLLHMLLFTIFFNFFWVLCLLALLNQFCKTSSKSPVLRIIAKVRLMSCWFDFPWLAAWARFCKSPMCLKTKWGEVLIIQTTDFTFVSWALRSSCNTSPKLLKRKVRISGKVWLRVLVLSSCYSNMYLGSMAASICFTSAILRLTISWNLRKHSKYFLHVQRAWIGSVPAGMRGKMPQLV